MGFLAPEDAAASLFFGQRESFAPSLFDHAGVRLPLARAPRRKRRGQSLFRLLTAQPVVTTSYFMRQNQKQYKFEFEPKVLVFRRPAKSVLFELDACRFFRRCIPRFQAIAAAFERAGLETIGDVLVLSPEELQMRLYTFGSLNRTQAKRAVQKIQAGLKTAPIGADANGHPKFYPLGQWIPARSAICRDASLRRTEPRHRPRSPSGPGFSPMLSLA